MKFPKNLVTFTEEILNGKLHFLCSDICFDGFVEEMEYGSVVLCKISEMKIW